VLVPKSVILLGEKMEIQIRQELKASSCFQKKRPHFWGHSQRGKR